MRKTVVPHLQRFFFCIFILTSILFRQVEALNRDYYSVWRVEQHTSQPLCLYHAEHSDWPDGVVSRLGEELYYLIPETGPECHWCYRRSFYTGYIDSNFYKYLPHLIRQLEYCRRHHCTCVCYWPEYSEGASRISDMAYLLFRDLILTTELSSLLTNTNDFSKLFFPENWCWTQHGLTISFIVHQFRFSDYYHVCQDLETFAKSRYSEREFAKIQDKLEKILIVLYSHFYTLYSSCYKMHPTDDIVQEMRFMKLMINDISGLDDAVDLSKNEHLFFVNTDITLSDLSELIISDLKTAGIPVGQNQGIPSYDPEYRQDEQCYLAPFESATMPLSREFSLQSEIFLGQGTMLNNLLLHKDAIRALTSSIQLNPSNRNAYIERAMSYFETNQLSLALKDYESAKALVIESRAMAAVYIPENKTEFSKGLVSGTVEGAKASVVDFFPSIFGCCRGILNGLWAFACSPVEVRQDMANTAYAIGEFLNDHRTEECFQCLIPELRLLSFSWDTLNDYSKGQSIGFIIGKYGVDIFAPIGVFNGINKVRALKRANTMCTLEVCATSLPKQSKILEESTKRATLRERMIADSVKNGRILTKTHNVQYHVMQPKHAWDKALKLSGNIEEDFKKVVAFLENKNIMSSKNLRNTVALPKDTPVKSIHLLEYRATIEGQEIQAFFEKYLDTGEIFLKNAWIIKK
jgi:hypothetical protein